MHGFAVDREVSRPVQPGSTSQPQNRMVNRETANHLISQLESVAILTGQPGPVSEPRNRTVNRETANRLVSWVEFLAKYDLSPGPNRPTARPDDSRFRGRRG